MPVSIPPPGFFAKQPVQHWPFATCDDLLTALGVTRVPPTGNVKYVIVPSEKHYFWPNENSLPHQYIAALAAFYKIADTFANDSNVVLDAYRSLVFCASGAPTHNNIDDAGILAEKDRDNIVSTGGGGEIHSLLQVKEYASPVSFDATADVASHMKDFNSQDASDFSSSTRLAALEQLHGNYARFAKPSTASDGVSDRMSGGRASNTLYNCSIQNKFDLLSEDVAELDDEGFFDGDDVEPAAVETVSHTPPALFDTVGDVTFEEEDCDGHSSPVFFVKDFNSQENSTSAFLDACHASPDLYDAGHASPEYLKNFNSQEQANTEKTKDYRMDHVAGSESMLTLTSLRTERLPGLLGHGSNNARTAHHGFPGPGPVAHGAPGLGPSFGRTAHHDECSTIKDFNSQKNCLLCHRQQDFNSQELCSVCVKDFKTQSLRTLMQVRHASPVLSDTILKEDTLAPPALHGPVPGPCPGPGPGPSNPTGQPSWCQSDDEYLLFENYEHFSSGSEAASLKDFNSLAEGHEDFCDICSDEPVCPSCRHVCATCRRLEIESFTIACRFCDHKLTRAQRLLIDEMRADVALPSAWK
mmetsp:Transcript_5820/g.9713  ORF Transcript_5820/g.9713 Transcript_5820/m.9713 type:complete len:584 (-) Transcript_5820:112-1863(-)